MTASSNFLIPNGTLIVEVVAFLIVLGFMAKYVLPVLNRALEERQEQIRTALEAAETARAEADETSAPAPGDPGRGPPAGPGDRRPGQQGGRAGQRAGRGAGSAGVRAAGGARPRPRSPWRPPAGRRRGERRSSATLVMSVARQVIGREIDAASHRALIDEAVAALRVLGRDTAAAGRRADRPGARDTYGAASRFGAIRPPSWSTWPRDAVGGAGGRRRRTPSRTSCRAPTTSAVALTDFAVPAAARRAVLEDLLAARVHAMALRLVRAGGRHRVGADEFPTVPARAVRAGVRHMHDLAARGAARPRSRSVGPHRLAASYDRRLRRRPSSRTLTDDRRARGDRGRAVPLRPGGRVDARRCAAPWPTRTLPARAAASGS